MARKTAVGRDPESMLPLTPAVFHILLALAGGDSHGYSLMSAVEEITQGQMLLGPGTLYRSLQRMLVDDLIEEITDIRKPTVNDDRRYYRLTAFGRKVAQAEARRLAVLVEASSQRGLLSRLSMKVSNKQSR